MYSTDVINRVPTTPGDDAADGSPAAIPAALSADAIYETYGTRVYGIAARMLGNEADAEDVTQEVLLQVVRRLDTFRGEAAVMTWLYRVTVNAVLALRRKRAAARVLLFDDAPAGGGADAAPGRGGDAGRPEAGLLGRELRDRLEAAIARLPDGYRDPFVLSDVERLPNAEIARLTGLTVSAVKSRLHRARLMLRDALREYA